MVENLIEIPEIAVIPSREVSFWFSDFDLEGLADIRFQPLSDRILIRNLRDEHQRELSGTPGGGTETRVENIIVGHLIAFDQIDGGAHAELLNRLAGQVVDHLRSYLATEADVESVALSHGKEIACFIFEQMMAHTHETPADYRTVLVRAFRALKPLAVSVSGAERMLPIGTPAKPLSDTRSFVFTGTSKSAYDAHRFQSDTERRFALLLERPWEATVLRWIKPAPGQFSIEYRSGKSYEPDFVVETTTHKLIVEVKADNQMLDRTVQEKAHAAALWVRRANELAGETGAKPWLYALVPESAITESATLPGLLATYGQA